MHVCDLDGDTLVAGEDHLLRRLKSVRRGGYGAFVLHHGDLYPSLFVHLNRDLAYLHYFPAGGHPGYQAQDMTPEGCVGEIHFLQTNGLEADSFDMPDDALVSEVAAYNASVEFFRSPELPPSVSWFEL